MKSIPVAVFRSLAATALLEARTKLADLRNKVAGNEKLEDLLNDVLANTEQLKQLGRKDPVDQE